MSTESLEAFRSRVDVFFAELPAQLEPFAPGTERGTERRQRLVDAGLSAVEYPDHLGGADLTAAHDEIVRAAALAHAPGDDAAFTIGVGMAVPTMREYGSDELQRRFIPPALRGDEIWCQLYSEPGAGSDLADMTTRAVRDGDEFVISGQKVWTSQAHTADFGILVARTDFDLPKHRGITMFALPMDQPGVEVRPLVQMTGVAELNEVFLDEAQHPPPQLRPPCGLHVSQ